MDIKFFMLCLFSLCSLELVQLTPVPYRKLTKAELNQIALKCIDEINIDKSVIEKVLKTQILPKDDQKYKKYLACSYKKQGYLSPDGKKMLYNNLFEFLEEFYDPSDLKALDHCKNIQEADDGELCFKNLDCILKGLNKIEAERGTETKNDIESNTI
nr:odorant binding protein 20 [Pachyrhinus yasumatsui]